MAQTIKIKRSSVAGKVPATTDLDLGELAVNTHDGKVYTKKDNGTESIVEVTPNGLTNDNIAAGAAIADTKLATISTAGKVSNSATTATSANTASAIVARDGSGNFTAGTITAALSGNASTATTLSSARTFALTGDVTGTVNSDLTSGASITTAIAAGSIVNADVNASAAIAGTKISPDFGSQAVSTTGSLTAGSGVIDGGGLRITNTGSGNSLLVEDAANPDSTPFVIDATGRVINGHTESISTVNFSGTTITPNFQQHATDQNNATIATTNWQNSATAAHLVLGKSRGGAIGTLAVLPASDPIGFLNFVASDGTTFGSAAWVGAYADALTSAGSTPGRLLFATTSAGSTSPTERMRIRSDGNVGIGGSGNTNVSVFNQKPITGSTTAYAWATTTSVQSDVTGNAYGYYSGLSTAASTFRLGSLNHFYAAQGALGAGSAVTAQFGFRVDSSLDDADDNYAFHSALSSANCWNFFAAGTAPNYFAGGVRLGDTAASNELDDYEEGTFTPSIIGTTVAGTGTYSLQAGRYTKIGRIVQIQLRITWSAHTGTGNMRISNLPFTVANVSGQCAATIRASSIASPANTVIQAYALLNTNQITIESIAVAGGAAAALAIDAAGDIMVGIVYEAA